MKKILAVLITISSFSSFAQEPILGTWYIIESDGKSRERIVLSKDALITERLITYNVEQPYWKEEKKSAFFSIEEKESSYQTVGFSPEKNQYFAGEFWVSQKGELNIFQLIGGSASPEEALKKLNNKEYKQLLAKTYFSKQRMEEIQQLPTLGNLTKDDLLTTMNAVLKHSEKLEKYINESGEKHARFMAVKAIENLKNQKFIELGYNPFLFSDPYYMERFQEDKDVEGLNEKMTLMRF